MPIICAIQCLYNTIVVKLKISFNIMLDLTGKNTITTKVL